MEKKFMALAVLFVIFAGFQFAAPASAVKVVDHGTVYVNDLAPMKVVWKTYQYNNNFVKVYTTDYIKKHGKYVYLNRGITTIAKVTKNSAKITDWTTARKGTSVTYHKTKLTAAQYYWRVGKAQIIP